MQRIVTNSTNKTIDYGEQLASSLSSGDVVLLDGDLGAGKTQLVKGIAKGLGIDEDIISPTFNILLVYDGEIPIYHFDLYRLEDEADLEDIDFYGTIEGDGISIIEWSNKFPDAMPDNAVKISIEVIDINTRKITKE